MSRASDIASRNVKTREMREQITALMAEHIRYLLEEPECSGYVFEAANFTNALNVIMNGSLKDRND